MALEIKIEERTAKVELLNRVGSKALFAVDDQKIEVDIVQVEEGVYSIIADGISYNVELVQNESNKHYLVNTFIKTFEVDVIDAEAKYQKSRLGGDESEGDSVISSPMPGKVVKILCKIGDEVKEGQTLVVVEAMKMQSEYKVKIDRVVKEICVKEGDTVNAHQPLIIVE